MTHPRLATRTHLAMRRLLLFVVVVVVVTTSFTAANAFFLPHSCLAVRSGHPTTIVGQQRRESRKGTALNLFDFVKKRTSEGISQLTNLSKKASEGKLTQGLSDAALYTSQTNSAIVSGLAKSRDLLLSNLDSMLAFNNNNDGSLLELETVLLQADLGVTTVEDILEEVKSLRNNRWTRDDLRSVLRGKLLEALDCSSSSFVTNGTSSTIEKQEEGLVANNKNSNGRAIRFSTDENIPTILFVMGGNGMGKTTTIGKLAFRLRNEGGRRVLLAACDTFRAGAVEQLNLWAERAGVDCFSILPDHGKKISPASVLYGALDQCLTKVDNDDDDKQQYKYDTLIIDTSGRLSNNEGLTAELVKMKKVIQKRFSTPPTADFPTTRENVPHETLLVLDAAQGRMSLDSAKIWNREIGLTGLVLTKLDGSAKGGSVVAVSRELNLPVKLIGVGEGIEDLKDFNPEAFVDGLLGIGGDVKTGGKKSKSTIHTTDNNKEGKILALRLKEMRNERDARAKELKRITRSKEPVEVGSGGSGNVIQSSTASSGDPSTTFSSKRPKTPKKKKKKGGKK